MDSNREFTITAGLLVGGFAFGLLLNQLAWCLLVATLIWIVIHIKEYRKVASWTQRPLRPPRNGLDSWFALAYRPFRSLTRQRNRTRAMAARLRELLVLIEMIPDGVIVLDAMGDIENLNKAAKEQLNLSDDDIGLGLATVVRSPEFVNFIRDDDNEEPLEFTSPFDAERTFEARRFAIDTGGSVVLIRDVTTLNRLLTMRQNFVANVSHELRTPLTVVSGYVETMVDDDQPEDLRLSLAERLPKPLKRMQSLVDDLLLLTTLESTPVAPQLDRLSLKRIAEAAALELQSSCVRDDQIVVSGDTDLLINGSEKELHSVLINLLANAIRYSPEGESIEVDISPSGGNGGETVMLSVTDHGTGIAPEHLSRLTERFYRVDMAGARMRGGTGLGLAIVKHVLRRHNSILMIESELGKGSRFYCEFAPAADTHNTH